MSFFGFNIAGNAISAFQEAANVTADNISNVNTPGASRQNAILTEAPPIVGSPFYASNSGQLGTKGEGVLIDQIQRIHDDSYDGLFRGASSSQNYYTIEQQQLSALQSDFGEPNSGVNVAFTALQTALSNLAAQPTSIPVRASVLAAAQTFVNRLNQSGQAIQNQEATVLTQATSVVTKANTLIDQIASLNGQIRAAKAVGNNPNTFQDQRDQAIDQLSQLISTTTALQANGSTLVTVNGQALVNDSQAYHLAPPIIGTNANGTASFKIGFANDPNPSNPQAVPLGSGQLAAYADLYNNKLAPYGRQLDNFANAAAGEINRVTQAGVDLNGNGGTQLLQPVVIQQAISAANLKVGVIDPSQVTAGFISTAAGTLTAALNSANNTVDTSAAMNGNASLNHPPPAAGLTGAIAVTVDGVTQTYTYNTSTTDTTVDAFINNFNNQHFGVSATFDTVGQTVVFARDPNNIDLVHRALQGTNAPTPGFTISDTPTGGAIGSVALGSPGSASTNLLEALGGNAINNVPQTATNAYGSSDNSAANALVKVFTQNVGIGSVQTTSQTAIVAVGSQTILPPVGQPTAFSNIQVGQLLTIDATVGGGPPQENVLVTAVNRNTGAITASFAQPHAAGFSVTTAQTQTLGSAYSSLIGTMGLDVQMATTGTNAQTALSTNIDKVRQSIDGINIDEETQNLIKYQSAYQAAAKTLSTLDAMLQTILSLGGSTTAAP